MWREIVGANKSERAGGQFGDPGKSWAWRQNSSLVDLRVFLLKKPEVCQGFSGWDPPTLWGISCFTQKSTDKNFKVLIMSKKCLRATSKLFDQKLDTIA